MTQQFSKQRLNEKIMSTAAILALTLSLTACSSVGERLANIGQEPEFSPIQDVKETPAYNFVSMPMPAVPEAREQEANSLWKPNRKGFFKDQRASAVGDILTVIIQINDTAEMSNESRRTRQSAENSNVNSLLGYENYLSKFLPSGLQQPNLLGLSGNTSNNGTGEIEREEKIETRIAAVIVDVLPNGNFVLSGRQEVRLNYEIRDLQIAGVIRPEDISPNNSINYDQIAEARIAYGGRGQMMDVQQPRYGNQFLDIIYPF